MISLRSGNGLVTDDPWKNLASAIVAQAAHDYEVTFNPRNKTIDRKEIESFFRSDWYEFLTSIDS